MAQYDMHVIRCDQPRLEIEIGFNFGFGFFSLLQGLVIKPAFWH